jgi:hypothetical protein
MGALSRSLQSILWASAVVVGCDGALPLFSELRGQAGSPANVEAGAAGAPPIVAGEGGAGGTAAAPSSGGVADPTDGGAGGESRGAPGGAGASPLASFKVDDFEDGDTHAEPPLGWWYKVNDGSGTQTFVIESRADKPTGPVGLRSQGDGFTGWGAVVGVNFAGASAIDVSDFEALTFWAVAAGANKQVTIDLIAVGDVRYYAPSLTLSDVGAVHRVPLADFRGKDQAPLDATMLQGMQLEIASGAGFDLWLDDVEFVR